MARVVKGQRDEVQREFVTKDGKAVVTYNIEVKKIKKTPNKEKLLQKVFAKADELATEKLKDRDEFDEKELFEVFTRQVLCICEEMGIDISILRLEEVADAEILKEK